MAALVVVGVLLLTRGSPPGTPATVSSSLAGHASSPATAAAQTTQTTGVTIPAAFAGTWKGTAAMSAIGVSAVSLKNSIAFTFVAGGRTAQENNQDCVNTLTLTGATATALTFSEPQTAQCVAGMVTFTRQGANLAYQWTDNIEQNVATLRKS